MKVLLIGPYPPPHGGVSVHVAALQSELREAGIPCAVLDLVPQRNAAAPPRPEGNGRAGVIRIRGGLDLVRTVFRYARAGWTTHLHTNGHNLKSWLIVLACGIAGRGAARSIVTLHSGLLPAYLRRGERGRRLLARLACAPYSWVVCVSGDVESTLASIGVPTRKLQLLPAFIPPRVKSGPLPQALESWLGRHQPVLSTAVFFRSEYGLDLLAEAVARLRRHHPRLGLVVMGSGQRHEPEALIARRGLHDTAILAGDLDHDECVKMISRSDVFVRPTRADGDSISVREAVSLGIPTVASRVGTRPEGCFLFPVGSVDGLVTAIGAALRQRHPSVAASATDTVRRLLNLYGGDAAGAAPLSTSEWTGTLAYARTDASD